MICSFEGLEPGAATSEVLAVAVDRDEREQTAATLHPRFLTGQMAHQLLRLNDQNGS
jgi:hypothetical protein